MLKTAARLDRSGERRHTNKCIVIVWEGNNKQEAGEPWLRQTPVALPGVYSQGRDPDVRQSI